MAQLLESFEDEIKMPKKSNMHDVLREGIICFRVKNMIIPIRLCSPLLSSQDSEGGYYYVLFP